MRKQANSEDCFVCGIANPLGLNIAFYEHPDGSVRSNLTIRPEFQGWPGVAHGGIIATLLDEVTARVYMNDSTENKLMMTGKLEIRYRKPVPVGEPIEIVGMPGELTDELPPPGENFGMPMGLYWRKLFRLWCRPRILW